MIKTLKITLIVMLITILSKFLGFARDIYLASSYGATLFTDIYFIATTVPTILFRMIIDSFTIVFIPTFFSIDNDKNNSSLMFMNNVIHIVLLISVIICFLSMIFTKNIIKILAIGFDNETINITVYYTRLILPSIMLIGIINIFDVYLHVKNNFIIPALLGIPTNIIIILGIYLSKIYDIKILFYGTLLSFIIQIFIQIPFVYKNGYNYKFILNIKDKEMKTMLKCIIPVFLGVAVKRVNTLVDKSLASTLAHGSISVLDFAHKIDLFIFGVVSLSISTVVYRKLSLLYSKNDKTNFINTINKCINILILVLLPISVISIIQSQPIVKLLLERGSFNSTATKMTSQALAFYSIGILGYGLREILTKVFYSINQTKTPMINGILTVILNILLNFLLINKMKHNGLALATSISSIFGTLLLFISLRKKSINIDFKKILITLLKVFISSIIMAITVKISYTFIIEFLSSNLNNEILSLLCSSVIGFFTYLIFIKFMNIDEFNLLLAICKKRFVELYIKKAD